MLSSWNNLPADQQTVFTLLLSAVFLIPLGLYYFLGYLQNQKYPTLSPETRETLNSVLTIMSNHFPRKYMELDRISHALKHSVDSDSHQGIVFSTESDNLRQVSLIYNSINLFDKTDEMQTDKIRKLLELGIKLGLVEKESGSVPEWDGFRPTEWGIISLSINSQH